MITLTEAVVMREKDTYYTDAMMFTLDYKTKDGRNDDTRKRSSGRYPE
jgi:hypothetical protein